MSTDSAPVTVRPAVGESEIAAGGAVVAGAYAADDLAGPDYLAQVRDASQRAREAVLLIAVDASGEILGSVTYARAGSPYAQVCTATGAEFRMLGVGPAARGRGVGEALVQACIDRAASEGATELALSTTEVMQSAQRIYRRLGFERTPERDWEPVPGFTLTTYVRPMSS
jgi:ribosomal protein S18 acetylase RimI-like enzyme